MGGRGGGWQLLASVRSSVLFLSVSRGGTVSEPAHLNAVSLWEDTGGIWQATKMTALSGGSGVGPLAHVLSSELYPLRRAGPHHDQRKSNDDDDNVLAVVVMMKRKRQPVLLAILMPFWHVLRRCPPPHG